MVHAIVIAVQQREPEASRKFTVGSVIQRAPAPTGTAELRRKETAAQLLRLLGGRSLEDPIREQELLAALHFLPVPPAPPRWRALADSVKSAGPAAVQQKLSKTMYIVPDVECAAECNCSLAAQPTARRFLYPQLNRFLADVFEGIPTGTQSSGLPKVELNRFDLFHAHLFYTKKAQSLGLLFHSKEYPAYDQQKFPINLGYCQQDSYLGYDETAMNLRNMLWFQGRLCALDVGPESVLHHDLIMDGLQDVRTVLESDFGQGVIDVNYFASILGSPQHRLFLC
ncbi:hypothetical protein WJX77_012129 [Trebouxia sp. C0004]